MSRQSDFMTETRDAARDLWDVLNRFIALRREWDAQDYSTTLVDGVDGNAGITREKMAEVIFGVTTDVTTDVTTALSGNNGKSLTSLL